MVKYNELKPGLYVQMGDSIKSVGREYLGTFEEFIASGGGTAGVEQLAASVGWVFVALNKRKAKLKGRVKYERISIGTIKGAI